MKMAGHQNGACHGWGERSPVELQSELHLSSILGRATDPESSRAATIVRHREVRMVKRIQEIGPELDPHAFRNRKVLLQANVSIGISRSDDRTLSRTVSKCDRRS